jgi:hypothetical protein
MKHLHACLSLVAPFAVSNAEPLVKLNGLQVVFEDGLKVSNGIRTYGAKKGHGVSLVVLGDDKYIVGFDIEKAVVTIGGAAAKCPGMVPSVDRHICHAEFTTSNKVNISADGTLKIIGELPVTLATGKEEVRSALFKVEEGAAVKFPASPLDLPTLKVKSSGKSKWDNEPLQIVFTINRHVDVYAGIRFYGKDGESVAARRGDSKFQLSGDSISGEVTYTFKENQKELILAVEAWTGREEKKLKVDLRGGLVIPE